MLHGSSGADVLNGGSGADLLDGSADNDILTGGAGVDMFRFGEGDGQDIITDFTAGETIQVDRYGSAQSITQVGTDVLVQFSSRGSDHYPKQQYRDGSGRTRLRRGRE